MSANIITGYTGERHITPAMDASVYRSAFGDDHFITAEGDKMAGSMPSINEFTVKSGVASMQGHMIQTTQETLPVDTCANGHKRIDLVIMRFTHNTSTLIDDAELMILKGVEVADPNQPTVPAYNEGIIDSGASVVDFPLYRINLAGSSVTFQTLATTLPALDELSGIFSRVTYSVNNVSIGPGADNTQIFNVYRQGYTAIAVSSFYLSFTRTPSIYRTYLSVAGTEARISITNHNNGSTTGTVEVEILYVKN